MPQFVPFEPLHNLPPRRPFYVAFLVFCAIAVGNLPSPVQALGVPMLLVVSIPPLRRWIERVCRKVWRACGM